MTGSLDRPPALHELESEVMDEVWRQGSATVRDVLQALNESSDRERAYTTIMTILARLERKGVLARKKQGKGFVYTARATRTEYLEARAQAEVEALVESSARSRSFTSPATWTSSTPAGVSDCDGSHGVDSARRLYRLGLALAAVALGALAIATGLP